MLRHSRISAFAIAALVMAAFPSSAYAQWNCSSLPCTTSTTGEIWYSNGNVGIGTATPAAALDVPSLAHFGTINLDASSSSLQGGSDYWIGHGGANGGTDMAINGGTGSTTGGIEFDIDNTTKLF
jgi:hypothetical protein